MIDVAYPWILIGLGAPLLARSMIRPRPPETATLRLPNIGRLNDFSSGPPHSKPGTARAALLLACWACLVLAAARPQWPEQPVTRIMPRVSIMTVLDLSPSMDTVDRYDSTSPTAFGDTRLALAKQTLHRLFTGREHDRMGLIVFGSAPYLQAPFTTDQTVFLGLLDSAGLGMAGQQTMLGDALGQTIDVLSRENSRNRIALIVTDGRDTGSAIPPERAAKIARERGIRLYALALGKEGDAPDALDLATLTTITRQTGGQVFRVDGRHTPEDIAATFSALEPVAFDEHRRTPARDLFHIPLALFALLFAGLVLRDGGGRIRRPTPSSAPAEDGGPPHAA